MPLPIETDAIVKPGELIQTRIVHPDNERVIRQRAVATPLPHRVLRRTKTDLKNVQRQLKRIGYYDQYAIYKSASDEFNALLVQRAQLMDDIEQAPSDEIKAIAQGALKNVNRRAKALHTKLTQIRPALLAARAQAKQERQLLERLKTHEIALDQLKARRIAESRYAQEIKDIHDIIIETYTRLGHCWRFMEKGREVTRRVKIAEIHANADTYFFKIATTRKGWFGWFSELPRNVHPLDLIDPRTCEALSVALQLQVEGVKTDNNGIWLKVHRMRSKDGLMNHVKWRACIALLDSPDVDRSSIPVCLGIGAGRVPSIVSIADYPHFLIAGMSGSGKSNQVRNTIGTMISRHSPDEIQLVLVDMKEGTEFKIYQDNAIPHLWGNVIDSPLEFLNVLSRIELYRIERSKLFQSVYAVNLREYNQRVPTSQRLPRMITIIDEFGAIYLNDPRAGNKENKRIADSIKALIRQLLAKARSVGIQVGICTQTPYVEILPGPDKANISFSNIFRLPSAASSMAVMDSGAAASIPNIPGRGFIRSGGNEWLIQAPHVTPEDVEWSIEMARLFPAPRIKLELPALAMERGPQPFTDLDLIKLALDEYGGKLSGRKMWDDGIRHDGRIGYIDFLDMVKRVGATPIVEFDGRNYRTLTTKGGGRMLQAIEDDSPALLPESIVES